jgi:hypothetical protein
MWRVGFSLVFLDDDDDLPAYFLFIDIPLGSIVRVYGSLFCRCTLIF